MTNNDFFLKKIKLNHFQKSNRRRQENVYVCVYYFFIKFNGVDIAIHVYMQVIVIHSLLSFTILFIIDKSFMKHGVTAK